MRSKARLVLVLVLAVATTGCVIIEDGEVGVLKSFGEISDEPVGQGVSLQIPVARQIETWNVKLQEIKETAQVPSSEGLIVGLDASLLFKVQADQAPQIRKTIGWNYVERVIIPYFRNGLRDVVSGYPVRNIYAEEGRREIAGRVFDRFDRDVVPRLPWLPASVIHKPWLKCVIAGAKNPNNRLLMN